MHDMILTIEQLAERVPYSRTHIARLERTGDFPKRLRLGPNRIGWLASEVDAWIAERAEARAPKKSERPVAASTRPGVAENG